MEVTGSNAKAVARIKAIANYPSTYHRHRKGPEYNKIGDLEV